MQKSGFRQKIAVGLISVMLLSVVLLAVQRCKNDEKEKIENKVVQPPPVQNITVPEFNADSAFYFVKKQTEFGPRVPNTEGHKKCAVWLAGQMRRMGLTVIEQKFQANHYKGTTFNCVNLIGQYRPEKPARILFAAHWDSRFMADQDDENKQKAIPGADDGGSGVAVLLELARVLQQTPPDIGVDIILFDAEDQGNDSDDNKDHSETWCLGAQYWAKNPHRPGYSPLFGILLDMVGAANPKFAKEGISMQAAPGIVNKVWSIAASLGYGSAFVPETGQGITDDHLFVIRYANIPMIDIINRPGQTKSGFVPHWHTHDDNLSAVDKNTLKMVGQTCTAVVYRAAGDAF
jgi:glutaminyl-peptide cyclotransferase